MTFSAFTTILFGHIFCGAVLIGSSVSAPIVRAAIRDAQSLEALRGWLAFAGRAARWNPAASLGLLGTGLYLGSTGWWSDGWFALAITAWLINALLATLVVKGTAIAVARAAASGDGPVPAHVDALRRSAAWTCAANVMLANDLALLYMMLSKPTGTGAALLMISANLAVAAVSFAGGRRGARYAGSSRPASRNSTVPSAA